MIFDISTYYSNPYKRRREKEKDKGRNLLVTWGPLANSDHYLTVYKRNKINLIFYAPNYFICALTNFAYEFSWRERERVEISFLIK